MSMMGSPHRNPLDPNAMMSLRHWEDPTGHPDMLAVESEAVVDCGWGRLIFGQTFPRLESLVDTLRREQPGRRDVALYLRDPQVAVSLAPQDLFIDPSYTYRLALNRKLGDADDATLNIRLAQPEDSEAVRRIYQSRKMVPPARPFFNQLNQQAEVDLLIAEDKASGEVLGVVTGVDHVRAFNDPDGGASLWALAVDPQADQPGIGEALTRALADVFRQRGRNFIDLSVLHVNTQAIALYEKLGFVRVPVYCVKNKNTINEPLFIGPEPASDLNIYAGIIVREARRRGIGVEVLDAENGYFRLSLGGRSITCRESLCELTSAIAMSRCDDKRLTLRVLAKGKVSVPAQIDADDLDAVSVFLQKHGRVVVKPARGEQGHGVMVDLVNLQEVQHAIEAARHFSDRVIVEQMVAGQDLRIVVIDHHVVAAASRQPASVVGDGHSTLRALIDKQSRRRQMATAGESRIPMDEETLRCIQEQGCTMDSVLAAGTKLQVRKTANLHTGGTIHDMTPILHPALREAAERASRLLEIPLVGLDFIVAAPDQPGYVIIEANERPGLANHEPQPTVERLVDMLFPQTRATTSGATSTTDRRHAPRP